MLVYLSGMEKMFTSGVRRDLDTIETGRMELCEIDIRDSEVKELSRIRIEAPNDPNSYCEKELDASSR